MTNTDLLTLAGQDVGAPLRRSARTNGGEYVGPCPLCRAGDDRFHVWPNHPTGKARWWCRICNKGGDLADYLKVVHGLSTRQALQAAGLSTSSPYGDAARRSRHRAVYGVGNSPQGETSFPARRCALPVVNPPPKRWQHYAGAFVKYAQDILWNKAGPGPLEYLRRERGFTDETIRHFGLGYNPLKWYRDPEEWGLGRGSKVYLSPGIVIPCRANGKLWYVQVRRPCEGDPLAAYLDFIVGYQPTVKYWAIKGSQGKALFGVDDLRDDKRCLLLCEGEFDAMLAWQELGDLVDVVTLGGASKASSGMPARWLLHLLPYRQILVAYDVDENLAGDRGAAGMLAQTRRAVRVRVPRGSDLTDFWRSGGDLRAWLTLVLMQNPQMGK